MDREVTAPLTSELTTGVDEAVALDETGNGGLWDPIVGAPIVEVEMCLEVVESVKVVLF